MQKQATASAKFLNYMLNAMTFMIYLEEEKDYALPACLWRS
jgi:hypothetical protein